MWVTLIILLLIFVVFTERKRKRKDAEKLAPPIKAAKQRSVNDKMVVVAAGSYLSVLGAVQQFCIRNRENYGLRVELTKFSDSLFVVTFPYDVSFDVLCYFFNYLYYPEGGTLNADIKGWATPRDIWNKPFSRKRIMLFIPPNDRDYDKVYFTTLEGSGFVMSFASGDATATDKVVMSYMAPPIQYADIAGKPTESIG